MADSELTHEKHQTSLAESLPSIDGELAPVTIPIPGYVYDLCRHLRETQTPVEEILWEALRSRRLRGFKFRRQHPIGRYIVDFYCPDRALVVELDGVGHQATDQQAYDDLRDEFLQGSGRQVLRFSNRLVAEDFAGVLNVIWERLAKVGG